jgi:hypothetical protein
VEPRVSGDALHRTVKGNAEHIPGSQVPLPQDGVAFAEALHARIDLLKVSERFLRSEDEKVAQRELDLRLNLRYPKGSAAEEDVEIVFDVPRPNRPDA